MFIMPRIIKRKRASGKSFFDYSAKEKKGIIVRAARNAGKSQLALVKEYAEKYGD